MAELVVAEGGEQPAVAREARELDGCPSPPPAGSAKASLPATISPARGTRSTRTNSTHSTWPTTASRIAYGRPSPSPAASRASRSSRYASTRAICPSRSSLTNQ